MRGAGLVAVTGEGWFRYVLEELPYFALATLSGALGAPFCDVLGEVFHLRKKKIGVQ